ncbi:MAG: hypothetical protein RLZ77_1933, partial [Bacteroidota bacterium]
IDEVTYDDAAPWPDADGNGAYLQLISTSLDNNLASSWVANSSGNLPSTSFEYSQSQHISPNPVQLRMELSSPYSIGTVRVFSSLGQELIVLTTSENILEVDVSTLANGVYFVQSQSGTGNSFLKFIKQ